MALFDATPYYKAFNLLVATGNVSLQAYLIYKISPLSIGLAAQLFVFVAAYLVADFVNGLVHMYMDHNDHYEWVGGPLVASFHLHHKSQRYTCRPIPAIYFFETGSKVWLLIFLAAVALLTSVLSPVVLYFLLYVGILSSVAEVSHYLCHNSKSPLASRLARLGLLLSKEHHAKHHRGDNINYAFLNGFTDPLINWIASKVYSGYKETTDQHYAAYIAASEER
ncbi:MAG: sterol desaturase family protein [Planctomycetes bacterium]|nr:sterol desaturase family protein [Planctomycetota bacterium]